MERRFTRKKLEEFFFFRIFERKDFTFDFILHLEGSSKNSKVFARGERERGECIFRGISASEVNDIKGERKRGDKFQVYFRLSYCIGDV